MPVVSGMLTPAFQRSILVLSMGMLMFAAKIYQIPDLCDLIKSIVPFDVSYFALKLPHPKNCLLL